MHKLLMFSFLMFLLSSCVVREEPVYHDHHHRDRVYVEPVAPVVVEEKIERPAHHHRHDELEVKVR